MTENEGYDVAQVCLNGHVITSMLRMKPERGKGFCDKCGKETISRCPNCNQLIQGSYFGGAIHVAFYKPPNYCYKCGKPFPWTEAKLKAAKELVDELTNLTPTEQEQLKKSLDDIVQDTPQTPVATTRFKRLVAKGGQVAANALRDILVDIASEAAKKAIWG